MNEPRQQPDTTPAQADLSGRQLGQFRLLRRLGRGAMAEVYLAEQPLLRRRVAVKILKPELAGDRTYLKRFRREAQAAASLVHANIVQVHEVGEVDGLHFIAQEYVQGQNLREWLARNGPPDLPHALSIMRQVAAALAKAAGQGVVHRDIKPENIMLTPSGEVKVADFGLARVARQGETIDLTRVGVTMGTPLYMSPEQVEGKALDHRSDLYSLGVTCYHMLAGSPPFTGETALGVAVQHLKTQPEPLENLRPDLPPALCRMIHSMLVKDPERRCQSAVELLGELRRLYLEQVGDDWPEDLPAWQTAGVELPTGTRSQLTGQLDGLMKTAAIRRPRRRRLGFWAGVAGSLLLGALIAWLLSEPFLLADARALRPTIARRDDPLQQYLYASMIGTEEAWESVIRYFPKSSLARRAERELARIYFQQGDDDRALVTFKKLAALDDPDEEALRAFGLAGQYGVLTRQGQGDYAALAAILARLEPIRDQLDPQMRRMLYFAVSKNRSRLEAQTRRNWEKFLEKFQAEGAEQGSLD